MRNLGKVIQRRVYSFLNTTWGIALFVVLVWLLVVTLLSSGQRDPCRLQGRGESPLYCSTRNFRDNIASRHSEAYTAYEPIDVVYTWVNGSDPVWLAKKALWTKKHSTNNNNNDNNNNNSTVNSNDNNNQTIAMSNDNNLSVNANSTSISTNATAINTNSTSSANNQTIADRETEKEGESDNEDETMSSNRYRDSEELRYSLRSLVKNAPWIRHIYLVTDNQLPHWLNLETDRLSVVTHEEIFANKSHLPVFSSPAIEANLHRIPGLSRRFIYFNDDVFLGSPVLPDDFVSLTGAQKLVMAWEVPKCAPGCSDSWIGDGFCDRACNVSACNWDFPDCVNSTNNYGGVNGNFYSQSSSRTSTASVYCTTGCPDGWLADKVCDQRCKNEECGWDFGDCGSDLVTNTLPGVELSRENARLSSDSEGERDSERDEYESYLSQQREFLSSSHYYAGFDENELTHTRTETEAHETHTHTLPSALSVPFGTKAVYFNLSVLPCRLHFNEHAAENNRNNNSNSNHTQPSSSSPLHTHAHAHTCVARNISSFKFTSAEHDDENNEIVHFAAVVSQLHTLVVTLYHGQEDAPRPVAFPMNVRFTVFGFDEETSATASLSFSLTVTKPLSKHALLAHMPTGMGEITDAVAAVHVDTHAHTQTHTSAHTHRTETTTVKVLRVPTNEILLRSPSPNLTHSPTLSRYEGIVLHWFAPANNSLSLFENNALFAPERLSALVTVSLRNDSIFSLRAPLCALLAEFSEFSEISETLTGTHTEEHSTARFFTNAHRFCDDSFSSHTHLSHATERGSARHNRSSAMNMRGSMANQGHTTRAHNTNGAQTGHFTARNISRSVVLAELYQRQFVSSSLATLIATQEGPNEMALLKERRKHANDGVNSGAGVLLAVPLPLRFALSERDFVHVKIEMLSSATFSSSATKTEDGMQWRHRVGAFASSSSQHNIAEHEKRVMYISALLRWGTNRTVTSAEVEAGSAQNVTFYANDTSIVGNAIINTMNASLLTSTNVSELFASLPIVNSNRDETSSTTTNTSVSVKDAERTGSVPVDHVIASPERGRNETVHTNSSNSVSASVHLQDTNETTVEDIMSSHTRRRLTSDHFSLSSLLSSVRLYLVRVIAHLAGIELLPTQGTGAQPRRRLIDTYAQSLIFVNRMYNKEFGVENRRVPAHVPHMIDREVMDEMQSGKWAAHWRETSSHRFRSAQDMQYSFAYYHYLVHRHKLLEKDFAALLAQVADTDGDGFLNDNELRTLAAMSLHRTVQAADVQEIINCIAANSSFVPHLSGTVEYSSKPGKLTKSLQIRRYPTVAQAANCSLIRERLTEKVDWSTRLSPAPSLLSDKDLVAFEMLGDNATEVLHQLDSIRARQSKFVCVNDNMKNPTKEGEEAFRTFFEAFFPFPSDFELPPGQRNPTLYVDEYRALREQQSFRVERMRRAMREYVHTLLQPLRESAREAARRVIEALDEDGVYSLGQDERQMDREIMRKMERDLLYNPLHRGRETKTHREKETATETEREAAALAHFVLFLSVCAVAVIIVLRRCVISERESVREREAHSTETVRVWSEVTERQRREEMANSIQSEYEQIRTETRQEIYALQREQDDRQEKKHKQEEGREEEEETDERIDEERLTRRRIWGEQEELRDFFEREQYDDLLRLSALQEEDSDEPPLWQRLPAHDAVKKMR